MVDDKSLQFMISHLSTSKATWDFVNPYYNSTKKLSGNNNWETFKGTTKLHSKDEDLKQIKSIGLITF